MDHAHAHAGGPAVPDMPDELAGLLGQIVPPDGGFGHREHVHLAFLAAQAHGPQAATAKISSWIRRIAIYEHAPQKYNATMTRAWAEIVGYHLEADPAVADFGEFADRYSALLDKRLLRRHYSSAMLASAAARSGWVEPDLAPFPWS
ncbi:MAG TPA: hypothetical protein VGH96_04930 [Streptosporangiaceae bacterium]|jgi:hypothetical protein